jgi:hypothetical protein
MTRLAFLIAVCVSLSACGGTDASPTSPSTTSPSTFTLTGIVIGYDGGLSGASVTIMDGIHAGQTRTTDGVGNYTFTDLTRSAFTLQAVATSDEYVAQNQGVNLTTSKTVFFYMSNH